MDLSKMPLFALVAQRMNWLSDRQKVLAENIANADTPGYRAQDLAPLSFKEAIGRSRGTALAATHSSHISGAASLAGNRAASGSSRKQLSGNSVSLNDEMMKISETANDYSLVSGLYRRQLGMLRSVLSRN